MDGGGWMDGRAGLRIAYSKQQLKNFISFRSVRTRYEHESARLQAIVDQLEHENKDLRIQLRVSEKGLNSLEVVSAGLDRDSLLAISDVTKSFARKVKSNFQQSVMNPQGNSPAHQVILWKQKSTMMTSRNGSRFCNTMYGGASKKPTCFS